MADRPERRLRLADALNTYNDALETIFARGYRLFLVPDAREERLGDWWAIKDRRDFIADDPLRLLGLIALWEERGDDWYRRPVPRHYRALVDAAFAGEAELAALDQAAFQARLADLAVLFEALGLEPPADPTPASLARLLDSYYRPAADGD